MTDTLRCSLPTCGAAFDSLPTSGDGFDQIHELLCATSGVAAQQATIISVVSAHRSGSVTVTADGYARSTFRARRSSYSGMHNY
jgi:hypothetical protein